MVSLVDMMSVGAEIMAWQRRDSGRRCPKRGRARLGGVGKVAGVVYVDDNVLLLHFDEAWRESDGNVEKSEGGDDNDGEGIGAGGWETKAYHCCGGWSRRRGATATQKRCIFVVAAM